MASERIGEAFVLWLDADARPNELRGALEHVPTARRERFEDAASLVRLIREVRDASGSPGRRTGPDGSARRPRPLD